LHLQDVTPNVLTTINTPTEEFTIVPIGDVQVQDNDKMVAERMLRDHIKEVLDTQPNPMFIGMGDYIDLMSPSNRDKFSKGGFYDSTHEAMEAGAKRLEERFLNIVRGTEGKWIGLHEGHHFVTFRDGTTTDQHLAAALGTTFLGTCAYTRIKVTKKDSEEARGIITLWSHHGEGSRKYPASKLVEMVAPFWPNVDIFLMGHMHKADYQRMPRLDIQGQKVINKDVLAVVTGSWLKSYVIDESNYVEKKMLAPRSLGAPYIRVKPSSGGRGSGFLRRLQYIEG